MTKSLTRHFLPQILHFQKPSAMKDGVYICMELAIDLVEDVKNFSWAEVDTAQAVGNTQYSEPNN